MYYPSSLFHVAQVFFFQGKAQRLLDFKSIFMPLRREPSWIRKNGKSTSDSGLSLTLRSKKEKTWRVCLALSVRDTKGSSVSFSDASVAIVRRHIVNSRLTWQYLCV